MNEWLEFEKAVASFAQSLRLATVKHNAFTPDMDTLRPRQRDVWIEGKLGGHYPLRAVISCKRLSRKVSQKDIDDFEGQRRSSGANLGIIYSYSGFTKPALEKAQRLSISCCRLYRDEPPDLPEVLSFQAYCASSQVKACLSPYPVPGWSFTTWGELFDLTINEGDRFTCVLEVLEKRFHEAEQAAARVVPPRDFKVELLVPGADSLSPAFRVGLLGRWKFHRARLEAFLVAGSYERTGNDFKGDIQTPFVDLVEEDPGPGWELLGNLPDDLQTPTVFVCRYHGSVVKTLMRVLGAQSILPPAAG